MPFPRAGKSVRQQGPAPTPAAMWGSKNKIGGGSSGPGIQRAPLFTVAKPAIATACGANAVEVKDAAQETYPMPFSQSDLLCFF